MSEDNTCLFVDNTIDNVFKLQKVDTLIELLSDAIENEWSANAVNILIGEIFNRDYSQQKLIDIFEYRYGRQLSKNLKQFIICQYQVLPRMS